MEQVKVECLYREVPQIGLTYWEQQDLCRRVARKQGWQILKEVVSEPGEERACANRRASFRQLLEDADTQPYTVLVVASAVTLTPNADELDLLLADLLDKGVHTFSALGGHWIEPGGRHFMVLPW